MTARTESFSGLGIVSRFTVRRDRVRILVWMAAIVVLVVVTVASVKGLYPNRQELEKAAAASQGSSAAIVFNGPPLNLASVGGQVAFQTGTYGLIVMGLMSVFMLGRLTRGEEEAGRVELLRSLPLGRHAPAGSALLVVGLMNALTGALVAITLVLLGLPVEGSIVFGLSFAVFGAMVAAFTLLVAQVTENTRVVYGAGALLLGVSFVVRAVGDVGDGSVSWLSPIGWAQKTRPYAGEEWWPFLVILTSTALLTWTALVLARSRDLGTGLIRPRPGRARAAPSLGTPLGLASRLQRATLIAWIGGLAVLAAAYGSIADSINDFVEDNDAIADIIAARGGGTLLEQYMAMSFRILALIAAGMVIQSVLRVRGEETSAHAEQVLAASVSRTRFGGSHLTMAFGGSSAALVAIGATFGLCDAAVTGDLDAVPTSVVGALLFTPAVWLVAAVVFALVGVTPAWSAAAWGVLVGCFVVGMFGQVLDLPNWVVDLSPFSHVPAYPATGVTAAPLLALGALTVAASVLGFVGLRHRDIG